MISSTIKALILDLDGVLWTDNSPIGDLPKIFNTISNRSLSVALATNNSTRTPDQYIERLNGFGVFHLESWQVITSSLALADELTRTFPEKGDVFVLGENGLKVALEDEGFRVVDENHTEKAIAVAAGVDRQLSFDKLRRATLLIRKGLPFFGTNPDKTFPTPEGLILGCGAILAALTTATDIDPIIMGKPSPKMITLARKRLSVLPYETLVIGDRLETDIAGGQADGCLTALVYSGVTSPETAKKWQPAPDYFASDLSSLLDIE
jgi:4-nitrophenyl phosphatase